MLQAHFLREQVQVRRKEQQTELYLRQWVLLRGLCFYRRPQEFPRELYRMRKTQELQWVLCRLLRQSLPVQEKP